MMRIEQDPADPLAHGSLSASIRRLAREIHNSSDRPVNPILRANAGGMNGTDSGVRLRESPPSDFRDTICVAFLDDAHHITDESSGQFRLMTMHDSLR
jgi:hypothetical protein